MASTPEGKVKDEIKKILNSYHGVWWFMPVMGGYGTSGIPDFIACVMGKFLAIEAKATAKSKLRPMQEKHITDIGDASGYATIRHAGNIDELHKMMIHLGAMPK